MSIALIPGYEDVEIEENEIREIVEQERDSAELLDDPDFDLSYQRQGAKDAPASIRYVVQGDENGVDPVEPVYDTGVQRVDIHTETGQTRLTFQETDSEHYRFIGAFDGGSLFLGQPGYEQDEPVWELRYWDTDDDRRLTGHIPEEDRQTTFGPPLMRRLDLIKESYRAVLEGDEDELAYDIHLTDDFKEELNQYPEAESTVYNKLDDLRQSLQLGRDPEDVLFQMNPPYNIILGCWLGRDKVATFVDTNRLNQDTRESLSLPDDTLYGLGVHQEGSDGEQFHSAGNGKNMRNNDYGLLTPISQRYLNDRLARES